MSRTLKEEEHTLKRNEILDVAQRLVYIQGYEQMAIQDILDELHISKGAFYHYFDSKQDLLEALSERMVTEVEKILVPIVEDSTLRAEEKMRLYFNTAANWKTAQKPFIMALLRVWYSEDNAILRHKLLAITTKRVGPEITKIVEQGIEEGVFSSRYPDQIGEILPAIAEGISERMIRLLLSIDQHPELKPELVRQVDAYIETIERVLGAPPGSFALNGSDWLEHWINAPENRPPGEAMDPQVSLDVTNEHT
ncbi:MAG TPA: TetR/AcrR family transcriptional regulator [Anaerolineaceae bacterium]|nr:TetR/AcrR family transcriptional regulator [Anaerolineaceae bacterium]